MPGKGPKDRRPAATRQAGEPPPRTTGRDAVSSPVQGRPGRDGAPARRDGSHAAGKTSPSRPPERRAPGRDYEERFAPRSSRLEEVRSQKRDRFVADARGQRKRKTWLYISIPIAFFVLVGAALYFTSGDSVGAKSGAGVRRSSGIFTPVTPEDGVVKLPVADYQDGKARFYTYKTVANKEIDFFVLKSSDGVIRAAIDSCDVCFSFRKGYRQEGDEMVCNNCGQRFPSVKINEVKGGCNPAPLTRTAEGDTLTITEKDIVADGAQYF